MGLPINVGSLCYTSHPLTKGNKMAQRSKPISVKIATVKVIKALQERLDKIKKEYKEQEANEKKYDKAVEAWRKEMVKFATDNIKKATNVSTNYRNWNKTLNFDFDIPNISEDTVPKMPDRDYKQIAQWEYENTVNEIENALRILKMTDEETVSTSTYNAIAQYL